MYRMSRIGLGLLVAAVGCGEDATGPQAQFVLTAVTSEQTEGVVGSLASDAPTVRLMDRDGKPVANAEVRFDVYAETGGGVGSVDRRVDTTDAAGIASSGEWTLSTVTGLNVLRVTAYGALTLTFRAEAKPDVPALLSWEADQENQVALPGMTMSPRVYVRDRFGNSIAGVTVTFAVTAGGGALESSEAVTTEAGAETPTWTLGMSLGANTIRATALDLDSIELTMRVVEPIAIYDLTLIDWEPFDASQVESAFIALTADGHFISRRATSYEGHRSLWTTSGTYEIRGSTISFVYADGSLEEGALVDGVLLIERWWDEAVPQQWVYEIRS